MLHYELQDEGRTVTGGQLRSIVTIHGHQVDEAKNYFQIPGGLLSPAVVIYDQEAIILELKRKRDGWAGSFVRNGHKYGVNLNPMHKRPKRWGVTVWREKIGQGVA